MRINVARSLQVPLALATLAIASTVGRASDLLVPGQYGTIQAALDAAIDGDRVVIAAGTYTGVGNRDLDTLGKQVAVVGAGIGATVIDCQGSSMSPHGGFTISGGGASVSIEQLSVVGGYRSEGGALLIRGVTAPSISNCSFSGHAASVRGGAVRIADSASPTFDACDVRSNSAPIGGAIYLDGSAQARFHGCTIQDNEATSSDGGGIYAAMSAQLSLEEVHVSNNRAHGGLGGGARLAGLTSQALICGANNCLFDDNEAVSGGGLYASGNAAGVFTGTSFVLNSASGNGGGAVIDGGATLAVIGSNWFSNTCGGNGGALVVQNGGQATVNDAWLGLNHAGIDGGAVQVWSPTSELSFIAGVDVSSNSAGGRGGGISVMESQMFSTNFTDVHDNTASNAGGMLLGDGALASLANTSVSRNRAAHSYGGVRVEYGAVLTASYAWFDDNTAQDQAAGIGVVGATAHLQVCDVIGNNAQLEGGGVLVSAGSDVRIERCLVSHNSASRGAGLVAVDGATLTVDSTDVIENLASDSGAGAFITDGAALVFRSSDLLANVAPNAGGGASVTSASALFANSIVWGNAPNSIANAGGTVSATYCDIAGGFPGVGNIAIDPLFIAGELNVVLLKHGSPCIDAGDGALVPAGQLADRDGRPRFADDPLTVDTGPGVSPVVDIGAHEYADEPTIYCVSPFNSNMCFLTIASSGVPYAHASACSSAPFTIYGTGAINNKPGLLFWGVTGRRDVPWGGGTMCVRGPLKRTPPTNSGGNPPPANDCSGVFSIDFNSIACSNAALTVGTTVNAQWWGRDPSSTSTLTAQISNAIEFVLH